MLVQNLFGGRARCQRLLSFMRLYLCSFCDYSMQISLLTYLVLSFFLFYHLHVHAYYRNLQISDGS